MKPTHLINELKELIGDYSKNYSPTETQYGLRNAICVTISTTSALPHANAVTRDQAVQTLQSLLGASIPVLPNPEINTDQTDQILSILGQEHLAVVLDCTASWPENALGAAAGCIKSPGLLFLLMPDGLEISHRASPYETHLKRRLRKHLSPEPRVPGLWSIHSLDSGAECAARLPQSTHTANQPVQGIEEQRRVVDNLYKRCRSRERTTDLLLARRGRGKSATLGQLINRLIESPLINATHSITLTSPHSSQVTTVLKHAESPSLSHTPLQQALQSKGNILVVDEAGSVPLPVLSALCANYTHTLFAGTVDGYEGTGRALAIRLESLANFTPRSDSEKPHIQTHTLSQPMRWSANDPVETMVQDILRLGIAEKPTRDLTTAPIGLSDVRHQIISSQQLLNDEPLLDEVFGLLMQAHYQTTSKDLKHLLNQHNLTLWIQTHDGTLTGACLIAHEGGLNQALQEGIQTGKRRPAHQKLPVLLYRQCHDEKVLQASHWRIVRIAIKPSYQQAGLGHLFLKTLQQQAKQIGTDHDTPCDYIGASFGATTQGYRFWHAAGFQAIHWGYKLNPRSGQRALAVLLPVHTDNATKRARNNFSDNIQTLQTLRQLNPQWLSVFYNQRSFDEQLFATLIQHAKIHTSSESIDDSAPVTVKYSSDDSRRLALWKSKQLGLHEIWGPIARSLGGVENLAKLDFPDVTTAKQLTNRIKTIIQT